ncbi:Oligopeptide transporter 5 [Linum perenne]
MDGLESSEKFWWILLICGGQESCLKFHFSSFDSSGQLYNITKILNQKEFSIKLREYEDYSKLYLSFTFAFNYGISFAAFMATLVHVALFDGQSIWELLKRASSGMQDQFSDVHTRMMKNYEAVPQWWFLVVMVVSLALSFFATQGFNKQGIGIDIITELIIGYLYPGRPDANVAFKTYGTISVWQSLSFLSDFKLGQYMKVPPKSMFLVQLVGTLVASVTQFGTTWWILSSIKDICDTTKLPKGSPWTCPGYNVFYSGSIIWGVVGPLRIFNTRGVYSQMNWFFLVGTFAPVPVWLLSRKYPEKKWIRLIYMPIILSGMGGLLPAKPIHYLSWGAVGVFFNYYVYNKHKGWWARHTYILSAALDVGIAFMGLLLYVTLQRKEIYGPQWWGLQADDHCPLAKCPTVPGIVVKGCPPILLITEIDFIIKDIKAKAAYYCSLRCLACLPAEWAIVLSFSVGRLRLITAVFSVSVSAIAIDRPSFCRKLLDANHIIVAEIR